MNIYLFHRDLRLIDNTSLIKQLLKYGRIMPIFIFPPDQIDPKKNSYFSHNSVQFMIESLAELSQQIRQLEGQLYFFKGKNLEFLRELHERVSIKSIGFNIDYTPFARARDQQIAEWAKKQKIDIISEEDYVLYPLTHNQNVNPKLNKPYTVFTPFRNFCMNNLKVSPPSQFHDFKFQLMDDAKQVPFYFPQKNLHNLYKKNPKISVHGGRKNALKILSNFKKYKDYNQTRNFPSKPTTRLSAYLHFTTVSIRQVYQTSLQELGLQNNIVNELHWRQFYTYIAYHYPRVLKGKSYQEKFDDLKWKYDDVALTKWKEGKTGFPIIDAAMRELNETGFMHNRCRMIVACFLSKDLFLDWRQGEIYFASKLVDYSPMQNSGGWQWCVGNGTDAAPYFRIFNPWSQQKNYDKECIYIKKWLPELKHLSNDDIHSWQKCHEKFLEKGIEYYPPMIDHAKARQYALETYQKCFKKQE